MTLLTASRKSFSVAIFLRALMANMPASVHTLRISAPGGKHIRVRFSRKCWVDFHGANIPPLFVLEEKRGKKKKKKDFGLPVLLGHRRASSSKRISLSTLMERAWILKMCVRPWNVKTTGQMFLMRNSYTSQICELVSSYHRSSPRGQVG